METSPFNLKDCNIRRQVFHFFHPMPQLSIHIALRPGQNTPTASGSHPSGSDASRTEKERTIMSNNMNNQNSSSNHVNVPQVHHATDQFKLLTHHRGRRPRQGLMDKKMCPVRTARFDRQSRTAVGHCQRVAYIATITI